MILHLLEDTEERDEEIEAVHQQANAHQTDERDLVITEGVAYATFQPIDAMGQRWARERAVPRYARRRGAGYRGGEEIVKGECEGGGPRADEHDLEERVRQFPRGVPET